MPEIRNPELDREILDSIASGLTLKKTAERFGMRQETLCAWMREDQAFADAMVRARVNSQFVRLDECHDIMESEPDVQRARMVTDFRKWEAGKLVPSTYGDRIDISVTNRVDLSGVLSAAEQRAAIGRRHDAGNVIDAEIVETQQLTHDKASASIAGDNEKPSDSDTPKEFDPLGILE